MYIQCQIDGHTYNHIYIYTYLCDEFLFFPGVVGMAGALRDACVTRPGREGNGALLLVVIEPNKNIAGEKFAESPV